MSDGKTEVRQLASLVAKKLLASNHFATLRDTKEVLVYREGVYEQGGEAFIEEMIQQNVDTAEVSQHLCKEVIAHVQRSTYVGRGEFSQHENPHLVLDNCLLNVETLAQEPFTPEYFALNKMPARYDPTATAPAFHKFISEVLPEEDIRGVQEELGAIFRQQYLTKKFSIYLGETDTGKTTLQRVLLALLGPENVSSVAIQELASKNRFAIAQLHGKLANIRDDLSKDVVESVGKLKELTGGFQVLAEHKFQEPFNFTNSAYLIFACNVLPELEEDDGAFFNRVMIRNFTRRFGGKEKPDRELFEKLTTAEELSGILNWGLEGLKRLEANGWNFSNTSSVEAVREEYKRKSDQVWAYASDRLEEVSDGVVFKERLYIDFKTYCTEKKIPLLSKDSFFKKLPEKVTVQSGYREDPEDKKRKHCFLGVSLKRFLSGEKPAQPAQPALTGYPKGPSVQPVQPEQSFRHLSGTCEYCGENAPALSRTSEGHFVCDACLREAHV